AAAAGTRLGAHELPEERVRDLLDAAGPAARRAPRRRRPGLGAGSVAALATDRDLEWHLAPRPVSRLDELDLDLGGDIAAPRALSATAADAEQVVAEERREQVAEAAEVEAGRREAAAPQAGVAEPVVE